MSRRRWKDFQSVESVQSRQVQFSCDSWGMVQRGKVTRDVQQDLKVNHSISAGRGELRSLRIDDVFSLTRRDRLIFRISKKYNSKNYLSRKCPWDRFINLLLKLF